MLGAGICVCIAELNAVDMMFNYIFTQCCKEGLCIITVYVSWCTIATPNQSWMKACVLISGTSSILMALTFIHVNINRYIF